MPRYSLFGKKEAQETAASVQPVTPTQPSAQEQVLVLPRDDVAPQQPPTQALPQLQQFVQPTPLAQTPEQSQQPSEYDTLLTLATRLTVDQIKKYFTEEGIKEILRLLAEERNNPVAKLALAICGSSRQ